MKLAIFKENSCEYRKHENTLGHTECQERNDSTDTKSCQGLQPSRKTSPGKCRDSFVLLLAPMFQDAEEELAPNRRHSPDR